MKWVNNNYTTNMWSLLDNNLQNKHNCQWKRANYRLYGAHSIGVAIHFQSLWLDGTNFSFRKLIGQVRRKLWTSDITNIIKFCFLYAEHVVYVYKQYRQRTSTSFLISNSGMALTLENTTNIYTNTYFLNESYPAV